MQAHWYLQCAFALIQAPYVHDDSHNTTGSGTSLYTRQMYNHKATMASEQISRVFAGFFDGLRVNGLDNQLATILIVGVLEMFDESEQSGTRFLWSERLIFGESCNHVLPLC